MVSVWVEERQNVYRVSGHETLDWHHTRLRALNTVRLRTYFHETQTSFGCPAAGGPIKVVEDSCLQWGRRFSDP